MIKEIINGSAAVQLIITPEENTNPILGKEDDDPQLISPRLIFP